jgi:hypothetical protein
MAIKKIFSRLLYDGLDFISIFLAPFISRMAQTGAGSERCLKRKCLPVPIHYYSPIPDIEDLEKRKVWDKKSQLTGIDFPIEKQLEFIKILGEKYGSECDWPLSPTGNPAQFYVNNVSFSYGCAAVLHSMIRYFKPKKIIEIGSGNSSLVISEAITDNRNENFPVEYVIIDPYPLDIIKNELKNITKLIIEKGELMDSAFFDQLQKNDILFIDSGHTVKTGSDVNYLILDILPRIKPGVVIHFHDISLPYEYPKIYYTNPQFRVFWTEAYLLQAFLSFNPYFEVLLAMNLIMKDKAGDFQRSFPHYDPDIHKSISGSFWIRRKS